MLLAQLSAVSGFAPACSPGGMSLPTSPISAEDRLVRATLSGTRASRDAARRRLERFRFNRARQQRTVVGWLRFLRQHRQGVFADHARTRLAAARFHHAQQTNTIVAYRQFLLLHADHPLAVKAWRLLTGQLAQNLLTSGRRPAILAFLKRHPRTNHRTRLVRRLETIDFKGLHPDAPLLDLEAFLIRYPKSKHFDRVQGRIEERLAERLAHFGEPRDIGDYLQRYPSGRHTGRLRAASFQRRLAKAVLELDPARLQSLAADPLAGPRKKQILALQRWIPRARKQAALLRAAMRQALPWRPSARLRALVAAAVGSEPRVAAFAIRTLAHYSALSAVTTLLQAVGSSDSAVSSIAVDALARWVRLRNVPAARRLLVDRLAELRTRRSAVARLTEAVLRRTLGDWPGLLGVLASRTWYRPWNVVPYYLWLETLPNGAGPAVDRVGRLTLKAYQSEARKLIGMVPQQIRLENRKRAESAVFELHRLAHTASRLVAAHSSGGGEWVQALRAVVLECRKHRDDADRQLTARFPEYGTVLVEPQFRERRQHDAGRKQAQSKLRSMIRRLRPPALVTTLLCAQRLADPCRAGQP